MEQGAPPRRLSGGSTGPGRVSTCMRPSWGGGEVGATARCGPLCGFSARSLMNRGYIHAYRRNKESSGLGTTKGNGQS